MEYSGCLHRRFCGKRIVDFQQCNLHVMNYSTPVHATMPLSELKPHLYTIPEHPDWVPYRTSYYKEDWGFCLSYNRCWRWRKASTKYASTLLSKMGT